MSVFVINLITAICFALLLLETLYFFVSLILKDRVGRIAFLRSFKRGTCVLVYFSAIPLFCIGHMYAGQSFLPAFFTAINQIVNLVILKYEVNTISALLSANVFYSVTVYFCFTLVAINAVMFGLSLFGQRLWQATRLIGSHMGSKPKLYIFGNNPNNVSIYKSDTQNKYGRYIVDAIGVEKGYELYSANVNFVSRNSFAEATRIAFNEAVTRNKSVTVIVNTCDEEKNLFVCKEFIRLIRSLDGERKGDFFKKLSVYVFGDPKYLAIYEEILQQAHGCVRYVNRHQMLAMDIIGRYPITRFMDERHIDFKTSLVKKNVDVNVMLIGFGATNRQIFLTSVANNQFLTEGNELKKVNYHIYDKLEAQNNKNLNHNYYRYKNEVLSGDTDDYLPLPSLPAQEFYHHLDINDPAFYNSIKANSSRPDDVNVVIIAFGTDLENIDMAQKLASKKREWGIQNLVIFVKVRDLSGKNMLLSDDCYVIGDEARAVYDVYNIVGDGIFKMAMLRNEIYDLEYGITHGEKISEELVQKNRENAVAGWYLKKSQMERESSLYCCLSLRSKLHLMGLDYAPKDGVPGLSESEYFAIYSPDDMPDFDTYSLEVQGKRVINYTLDFRRSRRFNMAVHEHQRWNSFMISKGFIPSTVTQILTEKNGDKFTNGKNYELRRHGNLTTFEGLETFRRLVAKRDGTDEASKDVIKYDYQLLDDAYWLLDECGYKIIRKENL